MGPAYINVDGTSVETGYMLEFEVNGLQPGTYTATLRAAVVADATDSATLSVVVAVSAPVLSVSSLPIPFGGNNGRAGFGPEALQIALSAGQASHPFTVTLTTDSGGAWLVADRTSGSVGASGDLAPLAHLALPVIGEGFVRMRGEKAPAAIALAEVGLAPLELAPKEGLSLINGTQVTTAITALAIHDAGELMQSADVLGALSLDAMLGTMKICDPRIHAGKPHPGQRKTAETIATLIAGSALNRSHANCGQVQDAYSLRCMPQVHGAARTALQYVARAVEIELDSFTDNPLVLLADPSEEHPRGFDVLSGGNFHEIGRAHV